MTTLKQFLPWCFFLAFIGLWIVGVATLFPGISVLIVVAVLPHILVRWLVQDQQIDLMQQSVRQYCAKRTLSEANRGQ